ncbi:hypothetical protein MLD38_020489 [Melastoma candidum]|uniref:Uncharacterized protein n=1 Tax=Melastoma candidum TaxID=119954 RepID=A0ACB9QCM8_9MYRT|nr:hypothetical protein MLD38_020489 [Melastoma candidum]
MAATSHHLRPILLLLLVLFLSQLAHVHSQTPTAPRPKPKAILLPVRKNGAALQYTTNVRQRAPLVPVKLAVDLGAQMPWVNCEDGYISSSYTPVPCESKLCKLSGSGACHTACYSPPAPGCHNNTCSQNVYNNFIRTSTMGDIAVEAAVFRSTDGKNPGRSVSVPGGVVLTCGYTSMLEGLAKNTRGMVGLGRSPVSLPPVLSSAFGFPNKFAMCLSSSSSQGVVIFGDGPYFLQPSKEVSSFLMNTPLILNPVSTAGAYFEGEPSTDYFINVTGIKFNGRAVPLNSTLLKISKEGSGGTKLSTVDPYMLMETSIYRAVTRAFLNWGKHLKRVRSVKPFEHCFDAKGIGSTRVGPAVPQIELLLGGKGGGSWTIFGANSMVYVGKGEIMCLGLVDGGADARTSIVIGGHQLEDNLVQVDMVKKRLGFTSSLLLHQTTCANFNFTVVV